MSRHFSKNSAPTKKSKSDYGHKELESSSDSQSSDSSQRKRADKKKANKRHSSNSRSNSSSSRQQKNRRGKAQRDSSSESRSQGRQFQRPPQNKENEVIVKGLNYQASEKEIGSFFQSCGSIESMNILKNHDGTSKGIAFIRFRNDEGYNNALKQDGVCFMDFNLKIEKTRPREQRDSKFRGGSPKGDSLTIFVGNLSFLVNEHSLKQLFRDCGQIQEVRIAKNPEGKSRGFGYVEFGDQQSVSKALQKNGEHLDERPIRVDVANSKPKGDRGYQGRNDRDRRPYEGGSRDRRGGGRGRGGYGSNDWN